MAALVLKVDLSNPRKACSHTALLHGTGPNTRHIGRIPVCRAMTTPSDFFGMVVEKKRVFPIRPVLDEIGLLLEEGGIDY